MGCKDMDAVEEGSGWRQFFDDFSHPCPDFIFIREALFSLLHFAPKVGASVKPVSRVLLGLIPGGTHVMKLS